MTALPAVLLSVEHETRYAYAAPVDLAQHVAFLRPLEDEHQHVELFEMGVDPQPLHRSNGPDLYGNHRCFFTVGGAHRHLHVSARSRIRLLPRAHGAIAPASLPWEMARARLRYAAAMPYEPAAEFSLPSPYVPQLPVLKALAAPSFPSGRPVADAAVDLMQRIFGGFVYETASTTIDTPLAQVIEQGRGVCQDFAHLMIGALRMQGLAARYVSGYLLTQPSEGGATLVGADASHAWVAVWCPQADGSACWLELDPTNNVLPSTAHVRLAHGRDFGDVTPLRGVIRGGGDHRLEVRVTTRALA